MRLVAKFNNAIELVRVGGNWDLSFVILTILFILEAPRIWLLFTGSDVQVRCGCSYEMKTRQGFAKPS